MQTERARSVVELDGKQAQQTLDLLKSKATELRQEMQKAFKANDLESYKKYEAELRSTESAMKNFKKSSFDADAVFGYVIPVFDPTIPNWKRQREIYFEPIGNTGDTPLSFPTTNCMIKSDKVNQFNLRFNPEYGLSGGEDQVFFRLLSTYDAKFVVCREAITYETISANRSKLKSICKRATHQGNAYGRIAIGSADYSLHENTFIFLLKSILGIGHYGLQSLFFLPFKSKWIFSLIRLYLNIGKLSSVFQIKLLLYKSPSS